jgi:hypothetical protein
MRRELALETVQKQTWQEGIFYIRRQAAVLAEALAQVPAYRGWRRFDPGAGRPGNERWAALPALTKEDMRKKGNAAFVVPGRDIQGALRRGLIEVVHTSGSSGDRLANLWHQPWWDRGERASWKLNTHFHQLGLGGHREAILTSPLCGGRTGQTLPTPRVFLQRDAVQAGSKVTRHNFKGDHSLPVITIKVIDPVKTIA